MRARVAMIADTLRNSYWFLPGLITLLGGLLSFVALWADSLLREGGPDWLRKILFDGNTQGAAEILGTTSSSMITVAGVVFSITIVVLTLASGQFGPRLLDSFMRDRGAQVSLGTFLGGFLYALLVLRKLQFTDSGSVPRLSVTLALLWAVAGVVVLIYYIHHVSITIQAPELIAAITHDLLDSTDRLFPDVDHLSEAHHTTPSADPPAPGEHPRVVSATSSGYVQVVALKTLVEHARHHDLLIRLDTRPGRFLVAGTPIARVYGDNTTEEGLATVAHAVATGPRRTGVQDIEFPVQQLAEVAVRALSPAINDPFSAMNCIDQLSAALCNLAARDFPDGRVADGDGRLRVVVSEPVTWAGLVDEAYTQIRQNAAHHSVVYLSLLEALTRIAGCVGDPSRLDALLTHASLAREAMRQAVPVEADQRPVEDRWHALVATVEGRDEDRLRRTVPTPD